DLEEFKAVDAGVDLHAPRPCWEEVAKRQFRTADGEVGDGVAVDVADSLHLRAPARSRGRRSALHAVDDSTSCAVEDVRVADLADEAGRIGHADDHLAVAVAVDVADAVDGVAEGCAEAADVIGGTAKPANLGEVSAGEDEGLSGEAVLESWIVVAQIAGDRLADDDVRNAVAIHIAGLADGSAELAELILAVQRRHDGERCAVVDEDLARSPVDVGGADGQLGDAVIREVAELRDGRAMFGRGAADAVQ